MPINKDIPEDIRQKAQEFVEPFASNHQVELWMGVKAAFIAALIIEREENCKMICYQCERGRWLAIQDINGAWMHSNNETWSEYCKAGKIRARNLEIKEKKRSEIEKRGDNWYFYNETWSDTYGPYLTEIEARAALEVYAREGLENKITPATKWQDETSEPKKVLMKSGKPVDEEHREINPETGMQKDYVVLSQAERDKEFVRPLRHTYTHKKCGAMTTIGHSLAETYARNPKFYNGTFCVFCKMHFPVAEFLWAETDEQVGT